LTLRDLISTSRIERPSASARRLPLLPVPGHIFIRTDQRYINVALDDLRYIEAWRNYCRVFTYRQTYLVLIQLYKVENILPPSHFVRIHRSYIVSLSYMESFDNKYVYVDGAQLPIGETYWATLLEKAPVMGLPEGQSKKMRRTISEKSED